MAKENRISLRVEPETQDKLKAVCRYQHKTQTEVITGLIDEAYERLPEKAKNPSEGA